MERLFAGTARSVRIQWPAADRQPKWTDARKTKRKALLRKPAVQVELDLPPGGGGVEFVEIEPEWWQQRASWSPRLRTAAAASR